MSTWIEKVLTDESLKSRLRQSVNRAKQWLPGPRGREGHIQSLIKAHQEERLVLVLGAGVSMGLGLPSWNMLLHKLMLNTIQADSIGSESGASSTQNSMIARLFTDILNPSPIAAARYVQTFFHGDKYPGGEFEEAVRRAIYEELPDRMESKLFQEILALALAPAKSPVLNSIITYNYDDLLENYLQSFSVDIPFRSIYSPGMKPASRELPIYHVHGYLPREGPLTFANSVTLGEGDYHQQYLHAYSWQNTIQINKFSDYTCLFVGISFTDPNLRRLLDIAKDQRGNAEQRHYMLRKLNGVPEIEARLRKKLGEYSDLQDNDLADGNSLPETATRLAELMTEFEEKDATSFGVETIWIEEFDDIPSILKAIRQRDPKLARPACVPHQHSKVETAAMADNE